MSPQYEQFLDQANMHLKNSDWLIEKVEDAVQEFDSLDGTEEQEYIDDLYQRMSYLMGRLNVEGSIYSDLKEKYGEYML